MIWKEMDHKQQEESCINKQKSIILSNRIMRPWGSGGDLLTMSLELLVKRCLMSLSILHYFQVTHKGVSQFFF